MSMRQGLDRNRRGKGLFILLLVTFSLVGQSAAFAQGCPMCQVAAKAQAPHAQTALNLAILFLLVPPVVIMGAILIEAFRHRSVSHQPEAQFAPPEGGWVAPYQ